jgi:molybdopterin converting factor small subunit
MPGATATATPTVSVTVPSLLARFTDGRRTVSIRAATVGESVDRLLEAHPDLEPHLLDGSRRLRPHLKLFHEGTGVNWPDDAGDGLAEGDEVVVLQAVSGG